MPESIRTFLPLLIPLILLELGLMAAALLDLSRRTPEQVKGRNKWLWAAIIVFVNTIGPIIYFIVGREEE